MCKHVIYSYSLCRFLEGVLGQCKKDAVDEDSGDDEVVEELVGVDHHGGPAEWVPWREQEARLGRREPVDVFLLEALRDHYKSLKRQISVVCSWIMTLLNRLTTLLC